MTDVRRHDGHDQVRDAADDEGGSSPATAAGGHRAASSEPVQILGVTEVEGSDSDLLADAESGSARGHSTSAPQTSWRNFASLSASALSGDTIWHQVRADPGR